MEILENLRKEASERAIKLSKDKQEGTRIIEYVGNFVPEEMIYAAGAKPYMMCRGGEPEPPDAVLEDMLRFTNPLARSQCGFYKLGIDPVTPMADLIIASQHECHVARMAEYMELLNLPVHKVGVPCDWKRDFTHEYYYDQLVSMKEKLEEVTTNKVTDEAMFKYIHLYNEMYDLLRKISDLRKSENPPISGTDFIKLNHYTFFAEPEYVIEQLKFIYEELKDKEGNLGKDAPRILVLGHSVAVGDYIVANKIEELGAAIVYEMLEEGFRWYQWDIPIEKDPVRGMLRQRYLDKPPVNNLEPAWGERMEYVEQLIKDYDIDGVIWYQLLYDEIWDLEYSCVAKRLDELNVPFLRVETSYEYTREAMLPLNTRLESYISVLKTRKKGEIA